MIIKLLLVLICFNSQLNKDEKYYQQTTNKNNEMKKNISNLRFIIFSDDINWAEENLKYDNAIFCRKEMFDDDQDWYDMYLMTKCKGNIIANSSFSWWGAWLNQNEGHVAIAPNKWLNGKSTPDIWCEKWIRL